MVFIQILVPLINFPSLYLQESQNFEVKYLIKIFAIEFSTHIT